MINLRVGKNHILICFALACFCLPLSAQNDAYSQAISYMNKHMYDEARECFSEAAKEDPKAAYEYASALLDGTLGQRDTTLSLLYLTDLACYAEIQGIYTPFLKQEEQIFNQAKDDKALIYQQASIAKIKSLPQNNNSELLAIIYEAIGKCYGAEGDFIKAEEFFRKAAGKPMPSSYYYIQDPRLSLALFYLLIDGDYVEYQFETEGGVPFESLGIVNSTSLRVYKYKETRGPNDNTTYWLELFKKYNPEAMESVMFTVMPYTLNEILFNIYEYGMPNNPKDHDKAMLTAGEIILTGKGYCDVPKRIVADYYFNHGRSSQAWEIYRIDNCNYGMGKCYYHDRDFSGAMVYLSKALGEYEKYSKEEVMDALSLVSSMYRYGRGGVSVNEQLADKLLDASKKYNVRSDIELVFTFSGERITNITVK